MSVLVVITDESDAAPLTRWGYRFACCEGRHLIVLIAREGGTDDPPETVALSAVTAGEDPILDEVRSALEQVATPGKFRPSVRVKRGSFAHRFRIVEKEIVGTQVSLLLVGKRISGRLNRGDGALARRLFHSAPCRTLLLRVPDTEPAGDGHRILVPVSGGRGAVVGLKLVHRCVECTGGEVVPLYVQPSVGDVSEEVGDHLLYSILRKAGVSEHAEHISPRVVLSDSMSEGIRRVAEEGFDLVLLGASHQGSLREKLFGTLPERLLKGGGGAAVGVIRGPRPWTERIREIMERWLNLMVPQMDRADRVALFESLQVSSRWNFDFFALITLSTAIAGLGLIQNSAAVVIGAMLVAPLMAPLLGAGLALVQGNLPLIRASSRAIFFGFFTALLIGYLLGMLPGTVLTPELVARGGPELPDMAVALLSGMAAAYCSARPGLSAALPGVAIAAALVPPIATTGIALAIGEAAIARGAALLFGTNVVAIILGASISLYAGGVRATRGVEGKRRWVTFLTLGLVLAAGVLAVPLGSVLVSQLSDQEAMIVPAPLVDALRAEVRDWDGVKLLEFDVRVEERRVILDIEVVSSAPLTRTQAETLAGIGREYWHTPVLVRLHPEYIVEGMQEMEVGFGPAQ